MTRSDLLLPKSGRWHLAAVAFAAICALLVLGCSTTASAGPNSDTVVVQNITDETFDPQGEVQAATPPPAPTAAPAAPAPATGVDLQAIKPNELGTIPILEYHMIVAAEEDQWAITPDHFRQDLQRLYDAGYRPINLNDFLDGRIDIPAGTSPVALTFDDSSPGQFRFLERDGQLVVDPESAVGIMEAFEAAHLDFKARGTFNVLPEAEQPNKLFGQPEYEAEKLRYLVDHGFEIGNHSWWHQRLDIVDDEEVQRQLAFAVKSIQQAVPGYNVRTLALPLGMWPAAQALAIQGAFDGSSYGHDAVLLVGSDPAPSPYSKDYDPYYLERVQSFGDSVERWITYLEQHPDEHYISDGDPSTVTFPKVLESQLNTGALGNQTARAY